MIAFVSVLLTLLILRIMFWSIGIFAVCEEKNTMAIFAMFAAFDVLLAGTLIVLF